MNGNKSLNWYLKKAKESKYAIPHFNFATAEQLKAIILGFQKVVEFYNLPLSDYCLMVGTSEGEANFLGYQQARFLVDSWIAETGISIFLNADHHKSFETCKEAVDVGYDSVLIDASSLPLEENIKLTHKVADYAKSANDEISVEGELGYLRGESKLQETVEIKPEDFTQPDQAKEFIKTTGVDRLAIVYGNIHGIATKQKPELDFDLLKKINKVVPKTFLVLHGGSGLAEDDFKKSIEHGITNIHINTEVRVAYREGLEDKFKEAPAETTPYKFLAQAVEKMQKVVEEKVKTFLNIRPTA